MNKLASIFVIAGLSSAVAFAASAPFDPSYPLLEGVNLHGVHHWGTIYIFARRSAGTAVSQQEAENVAHAFVRDHGGDCDLDHAVKDVRYEHWLIAFSCKTPFIPPPPFLAPPPPGGPLPPEIVGWTSDDVGRDGDISVKDVTTSGTVITAKEAVRISQNYLKDERNDCTTGQARHSPEKRAWLVTFRCKRPIWSNRTK